MKFRALAASTALAVATTMGGALVFTPVAASTASASVPARAPLTKSFTCSGTLPSGASFNGWNCTMKITKFQVTNGALQAVGTLTGQDPSSSSTFTTGLTAPVADPAPNSCSILSLTLGPLHLDLLGLVVDIPNPIVVNITAVPGPGNLLGNLLCAVANLLNNTGAGSGVTALLNQINSLLAAL